MQFVSAGAYTSVYVWCCSRRRPKYRYIRASLCRLPRMCRITGRLQPSHSLPTLGLGRAFSLHKGQRVVSCLSDPEPSSHWSMHLLRSIDMSHWRKTNAIFIRNTIIALQYICTCTWGSPETECLCRLYVTDIGIIGQNALLVKEMLTRQPSQPIVAREFIHADDTERLTCNTALNIVLLLLKCSIWQIGTGDENNC